jgi:hypothetical protein
MDKKENSGDPPNFPMIGSVHLSLSNIFSYTLVSGAAMLAFFVAFQATLLANYPTIYAALFSKTLAVGSVQLPVGKLAVSTICVFVLVFNYWSYKITVMFGYYVNSLLISGEILETYAAIPNGPFSSLLEGFKQNGRRGHGTNWTRLVVLMVSLVWILLAVITWTT